MSGITAKELYAQLCDLNVRDWLGELDFTVTASRWSIFLGGWVSRLRRCLGIFIEMSSRKIQKG